MSVRKIDVSPDSTQIAIGTGVRVDVSPDWGETSTFGKATVYVWSLSTWKQLFELRGPNSDHVLPGPESGNVLAVKFSPDGRLIATAIRLYTSGDPRVRVNDSRDGHLLVEVPINISRFSGQPLTWSSNSKQLFALSEGCKIYCLDATTIEKLSQWRVPGKSYSGCITPADNGAFIAASAGSSVSFWDTTTHKRIGSVIEHGTAPVHQVNCMAISENYHVAIGGGNRITFRTIRDILPSTYVSTFASTLNQTVSLTVAVSTGKPRNKGWSQVKK